MAKIYLMKMTDAQWEVSVKGASDYFTSIEQAATYLEALGIKDTEIDTALIHMTAFSHYKSVFSSLTGLFLSPKEE